MTWIITLIIWTQLCFALKIPHSHSSIFPRRGRWSKGTNTQLHTKSSHTEKPKAPKNWNPEASCREMLQLPHNTFILKYSDTELLLSPITHHLMSSCAIYYDYCCCYNLHTTQALGCFLHHSFIINIRALCSSESNIYNPMNDFIKNFHLTPSPSQYFGTHLCLFKTTVHWLKYLCKKMALTVHTQIYDSLLQY